MKRLTLIVLTIFLFGFLVISCSNNPPKEDNSISDEDDVSLDKNITEEIDLPVDEDETTLELNDLVNIIKSFTPEEIIPKLIKAIPEDTPDDIREETIASLNQYTFSADTICYKYTYRSDNETVVGYLAKPTETTEKLPIIIFNRGGNRDFGMLTDETAFALAYLFAQRGYIVLASQYRGIDGGTGLEQFGGEDVNDIVNLIEIAKKLPYADTNNIFLYGGSRGGMMTYQLCRNNSDISIQAAVINSGVADLYMNWESREQGMKDVMLELIGGSPDQLPDEYDKRSATKWADEINVPLLILHSKDDWRVSYNEALTMVELLEKYGKDYQFISYDGDLHGEMGLGITEVWDWFEKYKIK